MYIVGKGVSPRVGTALVQRVQGSQIEGLGCVQCDQCKSGLGLFESGLDLSQWGAGEWLTAVGAVFALFSMVSTTKRGVRRTQKAISSRSAKTKKRRDLQRQLAEL